MKQLMQISVMCMKLILYNLGQEINTNDDLNISIQAEQTYDLSFYSESEKPSHRICYVTGTPDDVTTLTLRDFNKPNCNFETVYTIIGRTKFSCDKTFQNVQVQVLTSSIKIEFFSKISDTFKLQLKSQSDDKLVHCTAGVRDKLVQTDEKEHIIYYIVIPSSILVIFIILTLFSCYRFLRQKPIQHEINPYSHPDNNIIDIHTYTCPTKHRPIQNEYIDVIDLVSE